MTYRLHRHGLHAARLALAQHIAVHKGLAQQPWPVLDRIAVGGPRVDKHLERLAEAIGRPHGQAYVGAALVGHVWVQVLRCKLLEEGQQGRVALRRAILQRGGEVDLARDVGGGREGLGHGDVRGSLVVGVAAEGGGEPRGQVGVGVGNGSGAAGLIGRGRPSLWLGGLGFEGVEGKEAQVGQAWGPRAMVLARSLCMTCRTRPNKAAVGGGDLVCPSVAASLHPQSNSIRLTAS